MLILEEFKIPNKIINLIGMTLRNTTGSVKVQNMMTEEFAINKGLRQGDALSTQLFGVVLEKVMRHIQINKGGSIYTRTLQILAYTDDVNLIGRSTGRLNDAVVQMEEGANEVGLRINEEKTNYMINIRSKVRFRNGIHLQVYNYEFERVGEFKYLGSLITENSDNNADIKARIMAGNRSYYSVLPLLRSKAVSRTTKIRMYKTIIRPVVLCGSEAWCLTANDEKILRIWERKVLRKIFGPICVAGYWRSRTNEEVRQLYGELDTVTEIKKRKIEMAGTCGED
jgi:hypothetical protein